MGACCSKNTSTTALPPVPQQFNVKSGPQPPPQNTKNDQQVIKKEIFVIKHRISHEIDRHSDQDNDKNPNITAGNGNSGKATGAEVRKASCSKEEVDAILIQCVRLSRSNSTGAQNPNRRTRYSRSKRSFDFDLNTRLKNANDDDEDDVHYEDDALNHHRHRQQEVRVSPPSSRKSSRERDSRQQRSNSKERRISISPSRSRSESPFPNSNPTVASSVSSNRPAKMVSVPATDKSSNAAVVGGVKRIHVKRNVGAAASSPCSRSPARPNLRVFTDNHSQEQIQESHTREADQMLYRRKSLLEIDNNAARSMTVKHPILYENITRTRKLSRDLHMNQETNFDPNPTPPSYASMLLEDIHNFHHENMTATAPPSYAFALPECVSKACSIMEAVADLNSNKKSLLFSEGTRRTPTTIEHQIKKGSFIEESAAAAAAAAIEEHESSGSNNSFSGYREPNSLEPTMRECKVSQLGGFQQDFLDYPRNGIGRGRRSGYPIPKSSTIALT